MEIIGTIALAIVIGIMLFATLSLGLTLLALFIATGVVMAILLVLRESFRRWRFLHGHRKPEEKHYSVEVIETEYKDITDSNHY